MQLPEGMLELDASLTAEEKQHQAEGHGKTAKKNKKSL
jgi:hypothetical protein